MDQHGMKFVVDTTGVVKGLRDYRSAVDGIFKSLDQFEAHVNKTMAGVSKASANPAALNAFKKALGAFANVEIDTSAARKLSALSAALSNFRAPSSAQIDNTRRFFSAMGNLPDLGRAFKSIQQIDNLNVAMRGFKAPSVAEANNLKSFAKAIASVAPAFEALDKVKGLSSGLAQMTAMGNAIGKLKVPTAAQITNLGNFGMALKSMNFGNLGESGKLFATLAAIGSFRAPSAGQVKNLENFARAVSEIKVPANGQAVATYLGQISSAAAQAQGAMVRFRGGMASAGVASEEAALKFKKTHLEMMGMQNAFSATFQAGSLLRSLLGSLTIGELGRSFFDATQTVNQFNAGMEIVGENLTALQKAQVWQQTKDAADRFGTDISTYSQGFIKFAVAAHEAGMSIGATQKVFQGFQTAITGMHLPVEQQQSAFLAIREMMDKGYVSTTQLTKQLGNVLPGAIKTLSDAWAASGQKTNFFDALKKKMVDAKWATEQLADYYGSRFAPLVEKALESPVAQFNILHNRLTDFMTDIAEAGGRKGFADFLQNISRWLDPDKLKSYAKYLGEYINTEMQKLSKVVDWIATNWDAIRYYGGKFLITMGTLSLLAAGMKFAEFIATPFINANIAAQKLYGWMVKMNEAKAAGEGVGLLSKLNHPVRTTGAALAERGGLGAAIVSNNPLGAYRAVDEGVTALITKIKGVPSLIKNAFTADLGLGVAGVVGAILAGVGIAFAAAGAAAHDSGVKLESDQYTVGEKVRGIFILLGRGITSIWDGVTSWLNEKSQWVGNAIGIPFKTFGGLVAEVFLGLPYIVEKVGDVLLRTCDALGRGLANEITGPFKAMALAASGDWKGAAAQLGSTVTGGGIQQGFDDAFKGFKIGTADFKDYVANVTRGYDAIMTKAGQVGRAAAATNSAPVKGAAPGAKDIFSHATDESTNPVYQGTKTDGKAKPDKAFNALKTFEGEMQKFLDSLQGDSSVEKLFKKWGDEIDRGARLLLNKPGYKAITQGAGSVTNDEHSRVQELIKQIQEGHLNPVAKAGLAARGMSDADTIKALQAWDTEQQDKLITAMNADFDKKYKGINAAMKRLGESDPVAKATNEINDKLRQNVGGVLDATGIQNMQAALAGLTEGSMTAAQATKLFNDQIIAGHVVDGITLKLGAQIIDLNNKELVSNEGLLILAGRKKDVVGEAIRQEKDKLNIDALSNDKAKVAAQLQKLINENLHTTNELTQTQINDAKVRLEQMQKQNDLLARSKQLSENNGLRQFVKDGQTTGDMVNKLDHDAFQGLDDALFNLGKTGKLNFKSMLDGIQDDILHWASHGVTEQIMNILVPGASKDIAAGKDPTLFGKGGKLGFVSNLMGRKQGQDANDPSLNPSVAERSGENKIGADFEINKLGDVTAKGLSTSLTAVMPDIGKSFETTMIDSINQVRQQLGQSPLTGAAGGVGPTTTALGVNPTTTALGVGPTTTALGVNAAARTSPVKGGAAAMPGTPAAVAEAEAMPTTLGYGNAVSDAGASATAAGVAGLPMASITKATSATASSFQSTMAGMMPLIGLTFAGAFKSPIAQIGAEFLTMMLTKMMTSQGAGGIGGIFGKLFGGGITTPSAGLVSDATSTIGANAAIFKEGGFTGSPVSVMSAPMSLFAGAPHYAQGTPNTSGGSPAILHDNEAVIPLSRGRKVPVEMSGGGGGTHVTQNWNIQTPDADSFKRSRMQIGTDMQMQATRAYRRNNG